MKIDRRTLLRVSGALVAAASLHRPVLAESRRILTLIDAGLEQHDLVRAQALLEAGAKRIERDLVRQWRDGLRTEIMAAEGGLAYVRWDKALLLEGLARESGMTTRRRRLDRSCFEVRIGPEQTSA
jgi:hypothetical protein